MSVNTVIVLCVDVWCPYGPALGDTLPLGQKSEQQNAPLVALSMPKGS